MTLQSVSPNEEEDTLDQIIERLRQKTLLNKIAALENKVRLILLHDDIDYLEQFIKATFPS
jgi:hypothetical protein